MNTAVQDGDDLLPAKFHDWFAAQGWQPRLHQLSLLRHSLEGRSVLLIAPTGGGKTLAGFLPSLVELATENRDARSARFGPHTLYISPLKALAVDVARNLERPVVEMNLDVRVETRTGDTPQSKRQRQRIVPPEILMTTPEQLALLIALPDARRFFSGLRAIVLDELHAMATSKRGVLLSLGLARLARLAPGCRRIGLSATVAEPDILRAWLMPQPLNEAKPHLAELVLGTPGAPAEISILKSEEHVPWAGHSARYAMADIYQAVRGAGMTLIFVNTRSQAEMIFQELWRINDDNLPIALHHGSLDVAQRRKVETAMVEGRLRAVVCTSTLDLGIDWGDVDLVINVGAPKGASRLAQRIGRANHRLDEPSRAVLVPANRFEVLECQAAKLAAAEGQQDTEPPLSGKLDVLAQHILGSACAEPFEPDVLFDEIRAAFPYRHFTRDDFDAVVEFVATGGYALKSYERYAKLRRMPDGRYRVSHPRIAQQYRLNVGTIVEAAMLKVRLVRRRGHTKGMIGRGGKVLGEVEEWFIEQLSPGDTFVFAGQVLRFEGLDDLDAFVTRTYKEDAKVPSYEGGKFPLSTYLAARVRAMLASKDEWGVLPEQVRDWLSIQQRKSAVPGANEMLVETFPRGSRWYIVCYPFDGRLAHQTLGMLLTRRLERLGGRPLGFVANEYALAVWGTRDFAAMIRSGRLPLDLLFNEDMLGDDLDAWLAESNLMKRTFRTCAIIAGLIERRHPGQEKTGRQVTFSSDLIYDVLRQHQPEHVLLRAAWDDAATGLLDIHRLGKLLKRVSGHIRHRALDAVSPLAIPVMLEIGREQIYGEAHEALFAEAADALVLEAMGR